MVGMVPWFQDGEGGGGGKEGGYWKTWKKFNIYRRRIKVKIKVSRKTVLRTLSLPLRCSFHFC